MRPHLYHQEQQAISNFSRVSPFDLSGFSRCHVYVRGERHARDNASSDGAQPPHALPGEHRRKAAFTEINVWITENHRTSRRDKFLFSTRKRPETTGRVSPFRQSTFQVVLHQRIFCFVLLFPTYAAFPLRRQLLFLQQENNEKRMFKKKLKKATPQK